MKKINNEKILSALQENEIFLNVNSGMQLPVDYFSNVFVHNLSIKNNSLCGHYINFSEFKNCIFNTVDFGYGSLSNSIFLNCIFINCSFVKSEIIETEFNNCNFNNCNFNRTQIIKSIFSLTILLNIKVDLLNNSNSTFDKCLIYNIPNKI